ncbi:hypothetical protein [Smaragdicoccus niigatensis]|uniref:hypothetical protein n=1 Tax=Smaragdicoccus niigatensis TaxID=359359 RepID=UPI00039BAFDD|nr:hypothetical protein [Smaragdicoccus niigatensis]
MSQLDSDRAELQKCVETLEDLAGRLRAHDLLPSLNLPAGDRVAAAWDALIDQVVTWVAQFDEAVQRLSRMHSAATQTDADAADALERLA